MKSNQLRTTVRKTKPCFVVALFAATTISMFVAAPCKASEATPSTSEEVKSEEKTEDSIDDLYSEDLALAWSFAPTLLGVSTGTVITGLVISNAVEQGAVPLAITGSVLTGAGLVVGPGIGHFYVSNTTDALYGVALRAGLVGLGGLGIYMARSELGSDNNLAIYGIGLAGACGLGVLVSAVHDIAIAKRAARRANDVYRKKTDGVSVSPTMLRTVSGNSGYGLVVSGTF